jgi:hypothetical protein
MAPACAERHAGSNIVERGVLLADSSPRDSFLHSTTGFVTSKEYEMKATTALCLALAAAAFAGPANAIFKCTTAKGVVYQDRPCRAGNETDVTIVVTNATPARRNAPDPSAERRAGSPSTNGAETSERIVPKVVETKVPMTADQARTTDPSAKYYATEAFGPPGGETPTQMNCESPSGEKRVFYLTNGKLTSI